MHKKTKKKQTEKAWKGLTLLKPQTTLQAIEFPQLVIPHPIFQILSHPTPNGEKVKTCQLEVIRAKRARSVLYLCRK